MIRFALVAFAVGSITLFLAAVSPCLALRSADSTPEVERIRAHLAGAMEVLQNRDLGSLTTDQKRARSVHIARLKEYRDRGVFPHNHDFPDGRRPYFVDEHGVLCAMAYLILESGRDDIVRVVERSGNNATVRELAADPAIGPVLAAWLEEAGLSVAEAQRIQPAYDYGELTMEEDDISTGYAVASVLVTGSNVATSIANFRSPSGTGTPSWTGYAGFFGGVVGLGLGGTMLLQRDVDEDAALLGFANLLAGSVSLVAGASSIVRAKRPIEFAQAKFDAGPLGIRAGVLTRPLPAVGFSARF